MFFLCTHRIIQNLIPWREGTKDSKKNITTFLVGGLLYVLLLSFLYSTSQKSLVESTSVLFTLRNCLILIFIIDITAMTFIYERYYKKGIANEVPDILATGLASASKSDEKHSLKDFIDKNAKSFEDEVREAHLNEIDEEFKPQEDRKLAKSKKTKKAPKKETQDSGLNLVEDTLS